MKHTTIYPIFFGVLLASLLSSCSFLQKGEFSDRKYYNFPRSRHMVERTASAHSEQQQVAGIVVAAEENKNTEPVISASVNKDASLLSQRKSSAKRSSPVVVNPVKRQETAATPVISFKRSEIRRDAKKNSDHLFPSNAGLMMFLAVIASIFIPPLGVYIKDHRTHKWFWVTLLLWVLALLGLGFAGVEFIYTGLSGLFWLTAAVIALLVVFDII